jgi:hypothetical protein
MIWKRLMNLFRYHCFLCVCFRWLWHHQDNRWPVKAVRATSRICLCLFCRSCWTYLLVSLCWMNRAVTSKLSLNGTLFWIEFCSWLYSPKSVAHNPLLTHDGVHVHVPVHKWSDLIWSSTEFVWHFCLSKRIWLIPVFPLPPSRNALFLFSYIRPLSYNWINYCKCIDMICCEPIKFLSTERVVGEGGHSAGHLPVVKRARLTVWKYDCNKKKIGHPSSIRYNSPGGGFV